MQTRLLLCFCVFGIVSAEDDRSPRQDNFRLSQNGTTDFQPEVSVLPRKISRVFPNAKSFTKSSTVTSARENLITEPIVVSDSKLVEGKDDVPIPVPVTFLSNDTESTSQSRSSNSVQIVQPNKAIPVPVLVKAPPNAFRPVASTPRPFVPSPLEKEPTPEQNNLENPFSVVSSSFRLWPKLPEPVPVPVLAPKSFAKQFHEKSSAYVGPQYHPKPFLPVATPAPNGYQQNPVPVQYPVNSQPQVQPGQPQVQPGQPPNQGPFYLIIPGSNNAQPNPGGYQAPSQTSLPSQPQAGNQNYIFLQSPFGTNSQSSVPYQVSQNNGYSSNQGYSVSQQNQQSTSSSNYAVLASPNTLGGQQVQSGQQAQSGQQSPLTFLLLSPPNAAGSQSQPVDQQAALKYAIFGSTGNQANLGGQAPAAGFSSYAPQNVPGNTANSANLAGQTPLNFALLAPTNLPANSQGGQAPMSYAVFGAPNSQGNQAQVASQSPQNFAFSSAQAQAQPNSQPTLMTLPVSSNTGSGFPSSTPSPNVGFSPTQYSFAAQSPSSQYAGLSTPAPPAQPNYYQPTSSPQYFSVSSTATPPAQSNYYQPTSSPQYFGVSSTQTPSAQPNYYQPTSSPQYFGVSSTATPPAQPNYYQPSSSPQYFGVSSTQTPSAQPNYYQPTSSPQYFGVSSTATPPAQPNYYQPSSSPQYFGVSSTQTPSAQPNYYQPTSSPQYFGASSSPAPNYYQSASPSQFTGFSSTPTATAQPNYYQPTSSPQFAGFSSTPAPSAQPNYYQSTSAPQYRSSSDAQNFYQPTSTPSPTASPSYSSSPTSQVRFSGNGGSYSYFV